jgi:hypothetical protein
MHLSAVVRRAIIHAPRAFRGVAAQLGASNVAVMPCPAWRVRLNNNSAPFVQALSAL